MSRARKGKFKFRLAAGEGDVAYLELPTYPVEKPAGITRNVRLYDCLGTYEGPDVIFDFDEEGVLVGIEILA